ncbi:hypothetical protein N7456_013277 [Penicillium angulare]|uniref:Uncharacterized protein n=1 Tax=Penicillium angulare TaxID=116970 RepID=A0A9W9EFV3_9EURO|nr:hypothetical protein N7456_013277 [Penicillium angulare]
MFASKCSLYVACHHHYAYRRRSYDNLDGQYQLFPPGRVHQALAGLGIGLGQQQPQIAIQAVLPKADIPAGASIVVLLQTLSAFLSPLYKCCQNKITQN